ncbi:MAG: hypothetical protein LQ350_006787 [Teloschistes chrysophthalmus]|nr:MAG: hypothetical protein LQ350_006787 [Niorma chrysophthalma]
MLVPFPPLLLLFPTSLPKHPLQFIPRSRDPAIFGTRMSLSRDANDLLRPSFRLKRETYAFVGAAEQQDAVFPTVPKVVFVPQSRCPLVSSEMGGTGINSLPKSSMLDLVGSLVAICHTEQQFTSHPMALFLPANQLGLWPEDFRNDPVPFSGSSRTLFVIYHNQSSFPFSGSLYRIQHGSLSRAPSAIWSFQAFGNTRKPTGWILPFFLAGHGRMDIQELKYQPEPGTKATLNITVTTEGKAWCASHGDDSNIGFYNECLDWKRLERKLCTKWRFTEQPEGIEQKDWEFCFQFWGMDKTRNGFDVHEIQDFSFDGATRNLPWHEDYYAPKEVMDDTCSKLCFNKLSHMQRFDSKKGGDFSQITSYHHFDDICIKHMACDKGPKA